MRYEIHSKGAPSPATLLGEYATFEAAQSAFLNLPFKGPGAAWQIIISGRADELKSLGNLRAFLPRYSGGCFTMNEGGGFSCLGYDVAEKRRAAYLAWLESEGATIPAEASAAAFPGTEAAWIAYRAALARVISYHCETGKRCPAELTPALIGLEGKRVEVIDCYGETRRFIVGKSMGPVPCHLEIATRASDGGGVVTGAPFSSLRVVSQ